MPDPNRFQALATQRRALAHQAQATHQRCKRAEASAARQRLDHLEKIALFDSVEHGTTVNLLREQRRHQHLARLRAELLAHDERLAQRRAEASEAKAKFTQAQTAYQQIKVLHERTQAQAAAKRRRRRLQLEEEAAAQQHRNKQAAELI